MAKRIKIVFFDALFTIVRPRLPIEVQYAQEFAPYFTANPGDVKTSFKTESDAASAWWAEVIRRTAIGAGAEPKAVDDALPKIVPSLLKRFSSKEGYTLYDDTVPTLNALHRRGIRTGLVSNTDLRMELVLKDLGIFDKLSPALFSEREGIEKPDKEIWNRALRRAQVGNSEALHVGDELEADYNGAIAAGLHALLLKRPEGGREETSESPAHTISSLNELFEFIEARETIS
ncbi:SubName: Full=Uncharacterized protein {ECO:0000313/EMBL:CCA67583.1} [Serendipita indica DSM 11827]|nr:SubName: Full=Uncharacterized protein {ECO:0000313/EMBL:CCA67583.1} [Serendipita indica DSM 11827]